MAKFSNYPQQVNVPVGVKARSNFNFDHVNLTTLDFGRIKPIFAREVLPDDNIHMQVSLFSRASPLGQPSYTQIKHRMFAFFVPSRLLQSDWNDFINGQAASSEGYSYTPEVNSIASQYTLTQIIVTARWADGLPKFAYEVIDPSITHDFVWQAKKFRFTNLGAYMYDMLRTMGYEVGTEGTTPLSLNKLIAYQRIYEDWFRPSAYTLSDTAVSKTFATRRGRTFYAIEDSDVKVIEHLLEPRYCCFDRSYFSTAWQTPTGNYIAFNNGTKSLNGDQSSVNNIPASTNENPQLTLHTDITGQYSISQHALEVLRGVTNWFRRKALAGSRYYENILSQFGVVPDEARLDRTELLGTAEGYVNIGDVTSTADTPSSSLGSFAGKAIYASDSGDDILDINYKSQEHGYIIIVSTLLPDSDVVTGIHRENFHTRLNDFFQPELETVGTQAISLAELISPYKPGIQTSINFAKQIWGFCPNYAEYKTQRQIVSGDFAIRSRNNGTISNWHTQREFYGGNISSDGTYIDIIENIGNLNEHTLEPYISKDFMEVNAKSAASFDRIFQIQNANGADHFQANYLFKAVWSRPMLSLTDSLVLDGGREITMQYNGIQL